MCVFPKERKKHIQIAQGKVKERKRIESDNKLMGVLCVCVLCACVRAHLCWREKKGKKEDTEGGRGEGYRKLRE